MQTEAPVHRLFRHVIGAFFDCVKKKFQVVATPQLNMYESEVKSQEHNECTTQMSLFQLERRTLDINS